MDIIQRNFFNLLTSAISGKTAPLEPMSQFKWDRLIGMLKAQKVEGLAKKGMKQLEPQQRANLPEEKIAELASTPVPLSKPKMSNPLLGRKLRKIQENERHQIDASMITIELLNLIVANAEHMLNRGISLNGITQLGNFLRTKGDKVDFVKLDTWLQKIHLRRFAQLEGSILITVFAFEPEEIPFVERIEPAAYQLTIRTLTHTAIDTAKEWHFRQRHSGFVENNSKVLRRNLRRSIRYIVYSPIETTSNFVRNFARSLSEIEE